MEKHNIKNYISKKHSAQIKWLRYDLSEKKSINRWLLSELNEEYYISPDDTMDYVDYDKKGVNPNRIFSVRKYFIKDKEVQNQKNENPIFTSYYFPYENERVEFSGFWHIPTYLSRFAKTYIWVEKEDIYRFKAATCGRMIVWCNGTEVLSFKPYHRNVEHEKEFDLILKSGINEIVVFFDDLAERDTSYFFKITALDNKEMNICLPFRINTDLEKVVALEKIMKDIHFEKDQVCEGEIKLRFSYPSPIAFKLKINSRADIIEALPPIKVKKQVNKGDIEISIGNVKSYPVGFYEFMFEGIVDMVSIERKGFIELYPKAIIPKTPSTLKERKKLALEFISKHGELIMQRAFAMTEIRYDLKSAEEIIRKELVKIKNKYDCADFSLVALLSIWYEYREKNIYSEKLWNEIKEAILDFRFWCDELGNDVMWYFSENHALNFYTCQLLAGQLFPDEYFSRSQRTGEKQAEIAKSRLYNWFECFLENGFSEWNSSTYIPINLIAFYALYEYADDTFIKEKARRALDYTFDLITLNSYNGQMATTCGRTYDKNLKRVRCDEIAFLNWILFGTGYMNQATRATVPLIMSSYEYDKKNVLDIAEYQSNRKTIYHLSQGQDDVVRLCGCKTKDYILTSSIDYKKYKPGYQEHVVHALIGNKPEAQIFVNHPGESVPVGYQRPSYWAGNGILPSIKQCENIVFIHYKINKKNLVNFTHAYFPIYAFDKVNSTGNWYFAKVDDGYVAIYANNGLILTKKGINENRELKSFGKENSWIIKLGSKSEFGSFSKFMKQYLNACVQINSSQIRFKDPQHGLFQFRFDGLFVLNKTYE